MIQSLLLVGCGKMGGALLARWQEHPPAGISRFLVIDPHAAPKHGTNVEWFRDLAALPNDSAPDVIVFAVKPQSLDAMLPDYRKRFTHAPLYLSIAAGKNLAFFTNHLGEHAHVVRAMPNTPAMIGQGTTVMCATPALSEHAKHTATQLMEAAGHAHWIADESLMDAVTALSGSGPAYVFLFAEALAKAGIDAGLPADLATSLALETVSGSAALAAHAHEHFAQLRTNVTSPGGTTEAALSILMHENALEKLIGEAVKKAAERSKELSK